MNVDDILLLIHLYSLIIFTYAMCFLLFWYAALLFKLNNFWNSVKILLIAWTIHNWPTWSYFVSCCACCNWCHVALCSAVNTYLCRLLVAQPYTGMLLVHHYRWNDTSEVATYSHICPSGCLCIYSLIFMWFSISWEFVMILLEMIQSELNFEKALNFITFSKLLSLKAYLSFRF